MAQGGPRHARPRNNRVRHQLVRLPLAPPVPSRAALCQRRRDQRHHPLQGLVLARDSERHLGRVVARRRGLLSQPGRAVVRVAARRRVADRRSRGPRRGPPRL
eukprot:Amastigsp_a512187_17.p4 type:complete len:103 gc:universal Amastigsp_a512187_17:806-1114(+)